MWDIIHQRGKGLADGSYHVAWFRLMGSLQGMGFSENVEAQLQSLIIRALEAAEEHSARQKESGQ